MPSSRSSCSFRSVSVSCPKCAAPVPAEDVNIVRLVAKCRGCGNVFSFIEQVGAAPAAPRPAPAPLAVVAMPAGIDLQRTEVPSPTLGYRDAPRQAGRLVITRRWFQPQAIFLIVFAVFWNGFLVNWYTIAFKSDGPLIMFLFPLLHVSAGLWITYQGLTGLLNRTTITLADGILAVKHGPIPARGNRTLETSDVQQLYTEEIVGSKGGKTYNLMVVVKSGPTVALAKGLTSPQQALYIEQVVEEHLGIPDAPVLGSYEG